MLPSDVPCGAAPISCGIPDFVKSFPGNLRNAKLPTKAHQDRAKLLIQISLRSDIDAYIRGALRGNLGRMAEKEGYSEKGIDSCLIIPHRVLDPFYGIQAAEGEKQ